MSTLWDERARLQFLGWLPLLGGEDGKVWVAKLLNVDGTFRREGSLGSHLLFFVSETVSEFRKYLETSSHFLTR